MPIELNKISVVLFMDPRGVILEGGKDVIQRMHIYASSLSKISPEKEMKIVIFSSSKEDEIKVVNRGSLIVVNICRPSFNFVYFALKSRRYLKEKRWNIKLIISGDPWESFWSARFLNFLQKTDVPIQIQVHGDIASDNWKRISARNRIRFHLCINSLRRADSIRTVSLRQTNQLIDKFNLSYKKFVVVPVPILQLEKIPFNKNPRPVSISLVGRIHTDRGIWNFIELVKLLDSVRSDFKIIIIGAGPDLKRFLTQISSLIPSTRYRYFGVLNQNSLSKVWSEVGVLVSLAPSESHGRAMREALVAGVPVWATKSSGVDDLVVEAGKDVVKILDLNQDKEKLSKELDKLLKTRVSLSLRKRLIKDNSTYAKTLAQSWIDLITN